MRIAIIGSGISGLVCAHLLHDRHDVVLFEADDRPGGHSHTHRVDLADATVAVDTGFLVYNERTYPLFCRVLDRLGIATQPSDMSFSVADARTGLEWRGTSPSTVFAQRRNILRPRFLMMLADIAKFNRLAVDLLEEPPPDDVTLEDVLSSHRFSSGFRDWYLVPLGSSIWSAAPSSFTQISAATFARFFERHGLLHLRSQPRWRTISGGSQRYVQAIVRPLEAKGRLRLASPVEKIRREAGGVEVVSRQGRSPSITSCWQLTATGRFRCCRTPTGPSGQSWAPLDTSTTRQLSIPTFACCRAIRGPGPAGTITASKPTQIRRRLPTT